jgi:pyruvate-formate lyase-activating enzyme
VSKFLLDLVEAVGATPAGSVVSITVDGPDDVDAVGRWCKATGNSVLTVLPDAVEVFRGRIEDPIAALPRSRRPGYRLWVYTNFHCNLACDYCCVSSSPTADPRVIPLGELSAMAHEARAMGTEELFITGGEPFMLADLDERIMATTEVLPTTVLTNGMLFRGERLRRLESLPRDHLTLQISLDSATAELHDRHRGAGSFARALDGIRCAMELGFHVRVAATLGGDAGDAEPELEALFDSLDLDDDQRVVRRVARQGSANGGLTVSRRSLVPEVCITAEGVYWHPVAAIDPAMKVADEWNPIADVVERISDEYRSYRIKGDVLASTFPCA